MKYYQLLTALKETDLAPEQLAPVFGVSNMTLRRWRTKPQAAVIPQAYEAAIREGLFKLVIQGRLKSSSPAVSKVLNDSVSSSFEACIKSLGVEDELLAGSANNEESSALILAQIGHGKTHRDEVDAKHQEISKFKSFGKIWSTNITTLLKVVRSDKLTLVDKMVAYGALFYLLCPFDLIPDSIPVVGYLDDFAMIAIAVAFYLRNFPLLFSKAEI